MKTEKFIIKVRMKAEDKEFTDVEVDAFNLGNGVYLHKAYVVDGWVVSAKCGLQIRSYRGITFRQAKKIGMKIARLDWSDSDNVKKDPKYSELVRQIDEKYGW
jgi:hypothetical protein